MSNNLDKLKALTSRLEDKLEEKRNVNPSIPTLLEEENISSQIAEKKLTDIVVKALIKKPKPKNKTNYNNIREDNILRVKHLYEKLKIFEKSSNFKNIFMYKAMNLSGIGLKDDDFGKVRDGKYIQIIAITYEPDKNGKKKAKNISLGYFGKAETLEEVLKNEIIEFVLRWRYEKAFQNVEHYKDLIARVEVSDETPDTLF